MAGCRPIAELHGAAVRAEQYPRLLVAWRVGHAAHYDRSARRMKKRPRSMATVALRRLGAALAPSSGLGPGNHQIGVLIEANRNGPDTMPPAVPSDSS
jgi:hypothetical protein